MRKFGILLIIAFFPLLGNAATFGPEVPVAPPQHFSAFGGQSSEAVACGDQSCVALWSEWAVHSGLYSSVIDGNGNVQAASSNRLISGGMLDASIVWTGDHYLATWVDVDHSSFVAAALSRDGRISGAIQTLGTFVYPAGGTALAWNGKHAFAVFGTPGSLLADVLDANGDLVRAVVLPSFSPANWAASAAGDVFGVVWVETIQSTSTVKFQRYGDDGSALDGEPVVLSDDLPASITDAGIAGNATQFGIAYTPAVDSSIDRLRVDASTGSLTRLPVTTFVRNLFGIYWSGDDFVAYGVDGKTVATEGFSSDALHVLNVTNVPYVSHPQLAVAPTGAIAIWADSHLGQQTQHVFGALVDTDATAIVRAGLSISLSTLPQTEPALAPSNNGALLAWAQQHDDLYADIVVRRLNAAGAPVDAAPVTLATNVQAFSPSAVWLGNAWLVVWTQFQAGAPIFGKRVSPSGDVLDTNPIVVGHGIQGLLVTNGTTPILVCRNGSGIVYARLNANGEPIDSEPITITSSGVSTFAAATNGDEFLVVWADEAAGNIYAVRLTAAGNLIDTAPIPIADSSGGGYSPAIASDGRDFLIVYGSDPKVIAKRLLAEGSLAGTTALDEGLVVASEGYSPAVAWDGGGYVIAWNVLQGHGWTVVATTADAGGAATDTPRALGHADDSLYRINAAAANVQGTVLVAYPRGNAEDGIPQLFTRRVLNGPPRGRGVRR